jgi:hypothetical protein
MKNKLFIGLTTIGLTALLFTSCSKMPQTEMDAANAAIEQAKTAGAVVYANTEFIALQDSMKSVMINIESQNSKFMKNYSSVKKQLIGITALAQTVTGQAEVRKEEVKLEIQNTIAEVKTLIETNKKLILEAPKGKEGTSALKAIKSELSLIETSVNEADVKFKIGEYPVALDMVNASKEKAISINTELTSVIAKYNANKKGVKI